MRRQTVPGTALLVVLAATGLVPLSAATATAAVPEPTADFNGDGYGDLAVSAPGSVIGGHHGAGAVAVGYGSATGPKASRTKVISQSTSGVPGASEDYDGFGSATAAGDFDRDGYTDLAVSSPWEDTTSGGPDRGTVTVLWGGTNGLHGGTVLSQPSSAFLQSIGMALAAGDFDGDGDDDLAVSEAGGTDVWLYRSGGTTTAPSFGISTFDASALPETPSGIVSLASGDVNGDGTDDLVVGADPRNDGGTALYLSPGVPAERTAAGEPGRARSVALGDVDGDGYDDIVTGQPYEYAEVPGGVTGGKVTLTYGSAKGVDSSRPAVTITQSTPGVPGVSEEYDAFGYSVALGDINRDGHADLAVGANGETAGRGTYTGAVTVLHGSAEGLAAGSGSRSYSFQQDTAGVPGAAESQDYFGQAVALSDTNHDGRADLAVGAPGENGGYGAITSLRGSAGGIVTTGAVGFAAGTLGLATGEDAYPELGAPVTG